MLPSSPQLPPRGVGASAKVTGAPPVTEIFFNLPSAKNPSHCSSGEKNGDEAPDVELSQSIFGTDKCQHAAVRRKRKRRKSRGCCHNANIGAQFRAEPQRICCRYCAPWRERSG